MNRNTLLSFFGMLVVACSSTTNAAPGGSSSGGAGGASPAQTSQCKDSCDKMKFFDCASAAEQAKCYSDCDSATPAQIEVFVGCAQNSICDPECRTSIQPKETQQQGGGGASASSCQTACEKLISCSFIPGGAKEECNSECSSKGYQYQIDCINNNACSDLQSKCGGGESGGTVELPDGGSVGPDPTQDCLDECDSVNFFDCTTIEKHADCRAKCSTSTKSDRDTFVACSKSSGVDCTKKGGCLDAFIQ